jgi:ATP-binding cassette subfamily B protein
MSTISLADEVIVLEEGRIAAQGSHDELVEQSPLYREIAERGLPDPRVLAAANEGREVAGL